MPSRHPTADSTITADSEQWISDGSPTDAFAPFTFIHFGDPQIGMSEDGINADADRFSQALREAERFRPEFAYVSGDLVNRRKTDEYAALDAALSHLTAPIRFVPGNHDVTAPDDQKGLKEYRKRFGPDYYRFVHRNCEFIALNAITLTGLSADRFAAREEAERQWRWLLETLSAPAARGYSHRFLLMHIPPFLKTEDEGDGYFNLPGPTRRRFLSLPSRYDIRAILAGHTHTTVEVPFRNLTIYTVGGTAWLLDNRGRGFRVFRVERDRFEQEYVLVEDAKPGSMG